MKTKLKILALVSLVSILACSRSSDDNPSPASGTERAEKVTGEWVVSYYLDSGKDETYHYNGYTFTFSADGMLQATNSSQDFSGAWRIGDSSSDDDSSSNRFVITITGNKQMEDLSDDWVILVIADNEISLKDDNPESMEELRFSRKNQ